MLARNSAMHAAYPSVTVSVAATTSRSASSGRSGSSRETGTPAMIPCAASASTTGAAGFGSRTVNSLKKLSFSTSTPGTAGERFGELAGAGVVGFRKPRQAVLAQAASCAP